MKKESKGITLIALVITILVLLILAGVTIQTLTGDNGLLKKANEAKTATEEAEIEEQIKLAYSEYQIGKYTKEELALDSYMDGSLKKVYGDENVNISKLGRNLKIDITGKSKIFILKYDGTIKKIEKIGEIESTDVYGKIDEAGTLYLRATELPGYAKGRTGANLTNILKIIIEEPIAPKSGYQMFFNCKDLEEIENIENLHTENIKDMYSMFNRCEKLKSLDLSTFDTSNVTDMYQMFSGCSSLTKLDVSGFDTSSVTSMANIFASCTSLTELDLSNFDTSNFTNTFMIFSGCSSLTSVDLSSFNTSNVEEMRYMFSGCSSLTSLDLSNFDTRKVRNMLSMFDSCNKLKYLNLGENFIINEGVANGNIGSFNNNILKVKTTQSIAEEFKKNSKLTDKNFEIIE